eukprot:6197885-Pleurochrysis_carterae.AAC.1
MRACERHDGHCAWERHDAIAGTASKQLERKFWPNTSRTCARDLTHAHCCTKKGLDDEKPVHNFIFREH